MGCFVGMLVVEEYGIGRMWGFGVKMMKRVVGGVVGDSKMEVVKVFVCGGLVVVVVYGIYICFC